MRARSLASINLVTGSDDKQVMSIDPYRDGGPVKRLLNTADAMPRGCLLLAQDQTLMRGQASALDAADLSAAPKCTRVLG
jgi:hypothetical protein